MNKTEMTVTREPNPWETFPKHHDTSENNDPIKGGGNPLMKFVSKILLTLVLSGLIIFSFALDYKRVSAGGTIDFRNRITGARVFQVGQDAYRYKWRSTEPPELCDPFNNLALPINKVTVTPTLLMLNLPLARLAYRGAQYWWLVVQWFLLLGTGYLWFTRIPSKGGKWLWVCAVVGFTFTVAWRHHTDRGQAYVLMNFLLSFWAWASISVKPRNSFLTGIIAGLLMTLRPPLALVLFPFLILRRPRQLTGAIVGAVVFSGLPLLWNGSCWIEYGSGMDSWSKLYRAGEHNPRPPSQAFPEEVEGIPIDVLAHFDRNIPFADTALYAALRGLDLQNVSVAPVVLLLVGLITAWFWFARTLPDPPMFIGLAAWAFMIDFFLPAYRNSYTDVMILSMLALCLVSFRKPNWTVWLLLLAWPLGWVVLELMPLQKFVINLPTLVMVAAAVMFLLKPRYEGPLRQITETK